MNIRRWIKNNRIAVVYGGRSSEREISLLSGKAVLAALKELGADVVGIDAGTDLPLQLKKQRVDFAYLALHGPLGEDGTVQGLCEVMGIPYSGCGVLASALAMDKVFTKRILDAQGLPTPKWRIFRRGDARPSLPMQLPVVVKPATQGSAIGVSVVKKKTSFAKALSQSFALEETAIVEEYISGTEVTAGILGRAALPVIEIVPAHEFYDFTSKYQPGKSQHLIPPRLSSAVIRRVQDLAVRTFDALGCRAMARVDMIVDRNGRPWILEVNTIPGMTETSLFPDAARAAGLSFEALVLKIIEHSLSQ
jgi:D-alanine-D-alanine ligase